MTNPRTEGWYLTDECLPTLVDPPTFAQLKRQVAAARWFGDALVQKEMDRENEQS